jgi:hypothetical protein
MAASDYAPHVDDIALFFKRDTVLDKRWISHDIYTKPSSCLGAPTEAWKKTVFCQEPAGAEGAYCYVVNLSLLLSPGANPSSVSQEEGKAVVEGRPGASDLVVIPWSQPDAAYLVPRQVYESCPPLEDPDISDLVYMQVNEGVVLANMPRFTNLVGMTCYLLSLVSLRSGALAGDKSKTEHVEELRRALKPSPNASRGVAK